MTQGRHRSYLGVKRFLKSIARVGVEERDVLVDAAEALLLTRPGREDDAIETLIGAELVIHQLELTLRLDCGRAKELRALLSSCGPASESEDLVTARIAPATGRAATAVPRTHH
jgi:hypothetical protein